MSEGINFSDRLGRCVVMIGLPYPNAADPELRERMAQLEASEMPLRETTNRPAGPRAMQRGTASWEFYENICMKAVNQSIGRAIRHRNDYATVILADRRYCHPDGPIAKLPAWMHESLHVHAGFGQAYGALAKFFASKEPRRRPQPTPS